MWLKFPLKIFRHIVAFIIHNWQNFLTALCSYVPIKTHGSVLCGPRIQGAHKQREYMDKKNNVRVSACLLASWPLLLTKPNFLWRCWHMRGDYIPNLKKITQAIPEIQACKNLLSLFAFFFFSHTATNCHKIRRISLIALKFGARENSYRDRLGVIFHEWLFITEPLMVVFKPYLI